MSLRSWLAVVIASTLPLACGGSDNGGGASNPTAPTPTPPAASTISIVGSNGTQAFSPNPAPDGGKTVVFRNNDAVAHRIALNDGSADTGTIAPGATSAAITIPAGGTNYHCTIHPGMIGSVSAASGAPPPACEGSYCSPY